MEDLQKAVKLAAQIREESWDGECYKKSLYESADEAAESVGFDKRGTTPIYLLITNCWNEALDWANNKDI